MTDNKRIVTEYFEAFGQHDHPRILACLTDDVEWEVPGAFYVVGKRDFDREIENDAFTGRPFISVTRLIEEDDVVVAEGTVRAQRRTGEVMNLVFCDVFFLRGGLIRRLVSYLMTIK